MIFVLGCFLVLVGLIVGVLGRIFGAYKMEKFGNTTGFIGIVFSIVGFILRV